MASNCTEHPCEKSTLRRREVVVTSGDTVDLSFGRFGEVNEILSLSRAPMESIRVPCNDAVADALSDLLESEISRTRTYTRSTQAVAHWSRDGES